MELTDDELMAVYSAIHDEVYYGDYDVVYAIPGESPYSDSLRSALGKVQDEANKRRIV